MKEKADGDKAKAKSNDHIEVLLKVEKYLVFNLFIAENGILYK